MAFKIKGATPVAPPKDTHFELATSKKDGALFLRAITDDGKKFRIADITPNGLVLRVKNNHPHLGLPVDRDGRVRVAG